MNKSLRIIMLGEMGHIPYPGVTWEVLQYLEGFRRLGHDIWYIEDNNAWAYDPEQGVSTPDCPYAVEHIARHMEWAGMPGQWAYRAADPDGRVFGVSTQQFHELFQTADILINHAASTILREEHMAVPVRALLETDPGLDQILAAKEDPEMLAMLRAHTHFFTWAENYGSAGCLLPIVPFEYCPTRMPVVLNWFKAPVRAPGQPLRFTTIGNWQQSGEQTWNGETYFYSKHTQFLKFLDVPERIGQHIVELALASADEETIQMFASRGWQVVDPAPFGCEIYPFRDYITGSDGEFTVAKDIYARLRTGWFSDRSCYYLAAGRPVITQDTGFGEVLPTGRGLFAFNSSEEIQAAFEAINSDYERHSRAAREIACEYFQADAVLASLLDRLS